MVRASQIVGLSGAPDRLAPPRSRNRDESETSARYGYRIELPRGRNWWVLVMAEQDRKGHL